MRLSLLLCAVAVVGFYGSSNLAVAQSGVALPSPVETAWGFDLTGMDRSVAPGDDFYSYANGAWNRRTEIPSDHVAVGALQDLRGYHANLRVRDLLEQEPARSARLDDSVQKAVMLYRAFMDAETVREIGDAPLHAELQRLSQIHSKEEMAALMGRSFGGFGSSLFHVDLSTDDKDSKRVRIW